MTNRVYAVRLTLEARTNLDAAFVRLATLSNEEVARAWRDGLLDALASLATLPERCPIAPESVLFPNGPVRQLLYQRRRGAPTHRLLFTIHDGAADAPFVRIQHIRHGAQGPVTAEEVQAIVQSE